MDAAFGYSFPAIRGVQARRQYYVSMCPLRIIPKLFLFDEDELRPELRAQRVLNKGRIPEMAAYLLENRDKYVFSALTASIDGRVQFEPLGRGVPADKVGVLHVPMDAKFIINDGQHRRAAIETALRDEPDIGDETIAVVFFVDRGLEQSQQMFADLNRYAVRPSTSIGVLYDHRDEAAAITKSVVFNSVVFRDVVEMERASLSSKSKKLFTLSALHGATRRLLEGVMDNEPVENRAELAREFWECVSAQIPEWQQVLDGRLTGSEVRQDYIHSHAIALHSIAVVGNQLLRDGVAWRKKLRGLRSVDWSRGNRDLWEGRALVAGRVSKSRQNEVLTVATLKRILGLTLSDSERRAEAELEVGT